MIGGLVSEIQSLKRIKYESDLGSNEHYLCSGEIKGGTKVYLHVACSSLKWSIIQPIENKCPKSTTALLNVRL